MTTPNARSRSTPVRLTGDVVDLLKQVQDDLQYRSETGDKVTYNGTVRHALRSYLERNRIPEGRSE